MKKYLLPSALILVLGLGWALAQNITKAIQLSQDPTGAFGVDASNNVYFPAHVLNSGSVPSISQAAGSAPSIVTGSNDFVGQVSGIAASTTSFFLTFRTAYLAAPKCLIVQSGGTASTIAYNTAATGINYTSILGTGVINYLCSGAK